VPGVGRSLRQWLSCCKPEALREIVRARGEERVWRRILSTPGLLPGVRSRPERFPAGTLLGTGGDVAEVTLWLSEEDRARTLATADNAVDHVFDLLGTGPIRLARQIPWHEDWVSGAVYPAQLLPVFSRRALINPGRDRGAETKLPWEIGRFAHLVTLAQAYALTRDPRYSLEAAAQIRHFIESCPPPRGVQWACAMDVGLRGVSFAWSYPLLRGAPGWDDGMEDLFLRSCLCHGQFLLSHLEGGGGQGRNHYLANLCGLAFLGLGFEELPGADARADFAVRELATEVLRQFHSDGTNFEASVSYHRLALELALYPLILATRHGRHVPEDVWERLKRAVDFTRHYVRPDGGCPAVGDADDGRTLVLTEQTRAVKNDHRYLLSIGASWFRCPQLAGAAERFHPEALWLLGREGLDRFEAAAHEWEREPIPLQSRGFPDSGYYVLRDGPHFMFVHAGGTGGDGHGGHGHNDALSFELCVGGRTLIVDPGTYCYTTDYRLRNLFRSTAYHNTVMVDGEEINPFDPDEVFRLADVAAPRVRAFETGPDRDFLAAEHVGYVRLPLPVTHRRSFTFEKRVVRWVIEDELLGGGEHSWAVRFHFARVPLDVRQDGAMRVIAKVPADCGWGVELQVERGKPCDGEFLCSVEQGWIAPSYGVCEPAPVLVVSGRGCLPVRLRTLLVPLPFEDGAVSNGNAVCGAS